MFFTPMDSSLNERSVVAAMIIIYGGVQLHFKKTVSSTTHYYCIRYCKTTPFVYKYDMQTLVQSIYSLARFDHDGHEVLVDALAMHEVFFDLDNLSEVFS